MFARCVTEQKEARERKKRNGQMARGMNSDSATLWVKCSMFVVNIKSLVGGVVTQRFTTHIHFLRWSVFFHRRCRDMQANCLLKVEQGMLLMGPRPKVDFNAAHISMSFFFSGYI